MKSLKYLFAITALTSALTFSANATFIKDPDPGGIKMFIDFANKDVSDFEGFVGANNSSKPHIDIHTTGNVDTGSGYANIKPVKDGSLTELVFTPEDPNLFGDFSFRGQLNAGANETVTVTVQDNQGGLPQVFTFDGLGKNKDFGRIGIVTTDGETIKSVTLSSDFKEVKQIDFSFAGGVPDSGATAMLLGSGLAAIGFVRRYLKR